MEMEQRFGRRGILKLAAGSAAAALLAACGGGSAATNTPKPAARQADRTGRRHGRADADPRDCGPGSDDGGAPAATSGCGNDRSSSVGRECHPAGRVGRRRARPRPPPARR